MTLQEVLHAHIPTLRTDSCIRDAVDRMDLYQYRALLVVDEDWKPVATVTESDLVESLLKAEDLVKWSRQPLMSCPIQPPALAAPDDDVQASLLRMLAEGCEMLAVVQASRLVGVVTRVDLMQALLAASDEAEWPDRESIG